MVLDKLLHVSLREAWLIIFALCLLYLCRNRFHHGLNKYPGPFLASVTDWWRFFDVWSRRPDITHAKLHRRYGDIVRLGPNYLSFASPAALKDIYGLKSGTMKSEFYPVQQAVANGKRLPSLFSTTDESFHASLRRAVSNAFSLSTLLQYEPLVDSTTSEFLKQLQLRFADREGSEGNFDFARWLQYYAFDVIGELTYSKRHGFIDEGRDIDGIIQYLAGLFDYVAPIGQIPFLDVLWLKNPILGYLGQWGIIDRTFPVAKFAISRMEERANAESKEASSPNGPLDLLSKFQEASKKHPEIMTPSRVLTMAVSMAFAGSETTAISLSAVFYYLLKNPRCYHKLIEELDVAHSNGMLGTDDVVPVAAAQKMVYLDACIKEAFRLHPAAGIPLERITPAAGLNIAGEYIPGGTIVGCSAWIIHQRAEVFGDDVDTYRPERWIENTETKLKEMNGTMFQFGMGARTCIGKNISLLEIYKVVPSILRKFQIEFADSDTNWTLRNSWFVRQLGFRVRIKKR